MRITLLLAAAVGARCLFTLPVATGGPGTTSPSPPPPQTGNIQLKLLVPCNCYNFFNGLTTDYVGQGACARDQVHGIFGVQQFCMPKTGPYIPFVDEGCPSDMYHCAVTYTPYTFPPCQCTEYHNGATKGNGGEDACVKAYNVLPGQRICYRRNEAYNGYKLKEPDAAGVHDKLGGARHFGCPEDMLPCMDVPVPPPTSAPTPAPTASYIIDPYLGTGGTGSTAADPGIIDPYNRRRLHLNASTSVANRTVANASRV